MTEKDAWTFERFNKLTTDFETKLEQHQTHLMQNIENVMDNFEKSIKADNQQIEKTTQKDLHQYGKKLGTCTNDLDRLTALFNKEVVHLRYLI